MGLLSTADSRENNLLPVPQFDLKSRRLFASIVPALVLAFVQLAFHDGSEYIGGTITRPIFNLHDMGTHLLLISLIVAGWSSRIASIFCIVGAVLCLPMYAWGFLPGIYNWLFPGNYPLAALPFIVVSPLDFIGAISVVLAVRCAFLTMLDRWDT